VEDITDDEHLFSGGVGKLFLDRESVKQSLGGVGVGTVAGVDHRCFRLRGDRGGQAGAGVADDDVVRAHRLKGLDGLSNGLAFRDRGVADIEVRDIRREAFRSDLEGGEGACGRLVENGEHGFSLEGGDFFHRAGEEFLERNGLIEEEIDFLPSERCDIKQVFTGHFGNVGRSVAHRRRASGKPQ